MWLTKQNTHAKEKTMNNIILNVSDNNEKIITLTTRLNTVISKLNALANQTLEYELRRSEYIINNKKFKEGAILVSAICQDIDRLLEEEKGLRESLSSMHFLRIIKKRSISARLEEIDFEINKKMNQLTELKSKQFKTSVASNTAWNAMEKLQGTDRCYFSVIEREFNPLVENLNRLAGTNLPKHEDESIITFERIAISYGNQNVEEMV